MKTAQWEIEGIAEERSRREARRRNAAFRRQLEQRKAKRRAAARLKLKAATLAAALSWGFVAVQLYH